VEETISEEGDRFALLAEQLEAQLATFGLEPIELRGERRGEYLRTNVLAAQVELGEVLDLAFWKPWGRSDGELRPGVTRQDVADEMADVLKFTANVGLLYGVTDEDLAGALRRKTRLTHQRVEREDPR